MLAVCILLTAVFAVLLCIVVTIGRMASDVDRFVKKGGDGA